MTASQVDARAANAARHAYRKYADDLWRLAKWAYQRKWYEAASWVTGFALIAENAAWAEDRNP